MDQGSIGSPTAPTASDQGQSHQPRANGRALLRRSGFGLALLVVMVSGGAWLMHAGVEPERNPSTRPGATASQVALAEVRRWGYQLANLDPRVAMGSSFDLLVVDPDALKGWRNRTQEVAVDMVRRRPDGGRRLVLAYLSIGEAESYRGYWSKAWVAPDIRTATARDAHVPTATRIAGRFAEPKITAPRVPRRPSAAAPSWLADENLRWQGNFRVRYWDRDWQRLLFGNPQALLDEIVAAGFDGVYLDGADAHAAFRGERASAESEMVDLIERLAIYARGQNPEFLIVMQNAEELIAHGRLRDAIDGVAKEDLLFGIAGPSTANDPADVTSSLHYLTKLQREGRPVLVVEYLDNPALAADARRRLDALGFVSYFAPRELNRLVDAD